MIKHFFSAITGNIVSLVGTVLAVISLILIIAMFVVMAMGFQGSAYLGILTSVVFPMLFLLGLALIPIGLWWRKRKDAKLAAQGRDVGHLPVIDLNNESTRGVIITFVALSIPVIALAAGLTFKAVHYMDSTEFCGEACHKVMQPEYTAFKRSPHVSVGCAGCHIGPGAQWFVKAKISGSWQLIAVAFDLYPRPIPTPVHSLRPANGTCEQCHTPTRFVGDRLKVHTRYADDEQNTQQMTALMVKIGGKQNGKSHGIHWHVDPNHQLRYLSDPSRETIYEIELTDKLEGTKQLFKTEDPAPKDAQWRTMDCVDCHNRPSHIFEQPEQAVDRAITEGRISRELPFIRKTSVAALKAELGGPGTAERLNATLTKFYQEGYAEVFRKSRNLVEAAAVELAAIHARNVYPEMKLTWGTYRSNLGHEETPGCFRCHDGNHTSASGKTITPECDACHTIMAQDEENPKILADLGM